MEIESDNPGSIENYFGYVERMSLQNLEKSGLILSEECRKRIITKYVRYLKETLIRNAETIERMINDNIREKHETKYVFPTDWRAFTRAIDEVGYWRGFEETLQQGIEKLYAIKPNLKERTQLRVKVEHILGIYDYIIKNGYITRKKIQDNKSLSSNPNSKRMNDETFKRIMNILRKFIDLKQTPDGKYSIQTVIVLPDPYDSEISFILHESGIKDLPLRAPLMKLIKDKKEDKRIVEVFIAHMHLFCNGRALYVGRLWLEMNVLMEILEDWVQKKPSLKRNKKKVRDYSTGRYLDSLKRDKEEIPKTPLNNGPYHTIKKITLSKNDEDKLLTYLEHLWQPENDEDMKTKIKEKFLNPPWNWPPYVVQRILDNPGKYLVRVKDSWIIQKDALFQ